MTFPLPPYAHRPGRNARHYPALFAAVRAATPDVTDGPDNPAWRHGLRLLKAGYFWEAHEVLEPVWLNAPPNSREREAVRGVIQTANAALKAVMDQPNAAARLTALAATCFGEAAGAANRPVMGLDAGGLHRLLTEVGPAALDRAVALIATPPPRGPSAP